MEVIPCLEALVEEYNQDVLVNYDPFFTMEINRQWNQTAGEINDSFYNAVDSTLFYQSIDGLMSSSDVFLILGAGPVGLDVANALNIAYPDKKVFIYDSRAKQGGPPHVRPDYGRLRSLAGLNGITIKELEEMRLNSLLKQPPVPGGLYVYRDNIYTLYHPSLNVEAMVKRYPRIKFVFNCTGGRTKSLLNSMTNTLHIGRSLSTDIDGPEQPEVHNRLNPRYTDKRPRKTDTIIASDDGGNTYKLSLEGKIFNYPVDPSDTFIRMSTEYIITIVQGEQSIDIWATGSVPDIEAAPNGALVNTYELVIQSIHFLYNNGYALHPPLEVTLGKLVTFNPGELFYISQFKGGLKLSRRNLCQIHYFAPYNFVVKFDLGESMGSLPITSGSNIATAAKVLHRNLLPTVDRMISCMSAESHTGSIPELHTLLKGK